MPRLTFVALLGVALFCVWPLITTSAAQTDDPLCYAETTFCLDQPAIRAYFLTHGREYLLGYPVSRTFRLNGRPIQLFQRVGLALEADGQVHPLNILDDSILPLRHLAGVSLPPADPAHRRRLRRSGGAHRR